MRVCLERTIELDAARLRVSEWPGSAGPLVHVRDALSSDRDSSSSSTVLAALADIMTPAYRVLSLTPRANQPYQVTAADLLGLIDQFGFQAPILVAQGASCAPALLVAAWNPGRISRLVLIGQADDVSDVERMEARALRDCPPDWPALRRAVDCPLLELPWDGRAMTRIQDFLRS